MLDSNLCATRGMKVDGRARYKPHPPSTQTHVNPEISEIIS